MVERRVRVCNPLGLHARAAAQVVRTASRFSSHISITRDASGISANAKSIFSVLHLAAGLNVDLTISADGEDEDDAVDAVENLFVNGFGEI